MTDKPSALSKISVIMGDASFRERFHLIDCLYQQTLPQEKYESIWVEYYDKVPAVLRNQRSLHVITLNHKENPYHMSACFNEGIRQSTGELIVIPDADVVVQPTFLETIWKEHEKCEELVMYLQRWDEPQSQHTGDVSVEHLKQVCRFTNLTNYGGCLTVRKKWLIEVNGYEEDPVFAGLSANAMDLYTRFKNFGLHIKWHPTEQVYHLWHPKTLFPAPEYALQRKIINARDRSLTYLPIKGLDPNRNQGVNSVYEEVPELYRPLGSSLITRRLRRAARILLKGDRQAP